ncbi:transposase [Paraburkholderia sp. JPY432]|nr:transposase [Paraburkholderia youngii]
MHVGRKRVARLMRVAGLCGLRRRRWPAPRGSTRVRGARPIRCAGNSARKPPRTVDGGRHLCPDWRRIAYEISLIKREDFRV